MERNFNGLPEVTPEDIMRHRLERGDLKLSEYMEWLMGDRSWKSVKESVMLEVIKESVTQGIINKANLQ